MISRYVKNAAQAGANSNITSLSGLTTPLSLTQGGTGADEGGAARGALALQDTAGMTPLAHRRFEAGANLRVLVMGDSIAPGILFADSVGVLRLLQNYIGNAGGGGPSINDAYWKAVGLTTFVSTAWFRQFARVPAASAVEWSANFSARVPGDTAKVLWRAPVGGTATFKIQTCTDADGVGVGTWVDQGGVRTAVAGGASEEVGTASVSITAGNYRVRVLGVSGTVDVFGIELSTSTTGGCVILNYAEDGSAFSSWANLSDTLRAGFIDAINPDVVMLLCKDDPAGLEAALPVLGATLAASLASGYPRDLVIMAPYATVDDNDPLGDAGGEAVYAQREVMRQWAADNRATFIDLWDLSPSYDIFFADGVHLASAYEHAHVAHLVMERLGWLRYRTVEQKFLQLGAHTTYGSALGLSSNGVYYGSAVGYLADGNDQGAAIGFSSNGSVQGVAAGRLANGSTHGVALGNASAANSYGIAVGEGANGPGGGVAIGHGFDARGSGNVARCRFEAGVRTSAGGGVPAGRISIQATGRIHISAPTSDTAPTDSGASFTSFQNADGTIPRNMLGFQIKADGTALLLFVNVGGTVKSGSIALT